MLQLTFRMRRIIPLTAYRQQLDARRVHSRSDQVLPSGIAAAFVSKQPSASAMTGTEPVLFQSVSTPSASVTRSSDESVVASNAIEKTDSEPVSTVSVTEQEEASSTPKEVSMRVMKPIAEQIDACKTSQQLLSLWRGLLVREKNRMSNYDVNRFMSAALEHEAPDLSVSIFEEMCGFEYVPSDPALSLSRAISRSDDLGPLPRYRKDSRPIVKPNNFICTTATKAYGRLSEADKALALLPWLEAQGEVADVYFLSALLYVCAKERRVKQAEHLFWTEIPRRNLTMTVATINSIMYMYAKQNRPDDALRVYDMTKKLDLKCTVVTYGVLIKALLRSGRRQLQEASFDILKSLPEIGISAGIEVYNQFLEYFSRTHDFRQAKIILRLMSKANPKIKPDELSYGYLINCFADAKKPNSALAAFRQMRNTRMRGNAYTYMGVLKAFFHLRDGISSVQVLSEMREKGVVPDKRHCSMAMFTCVVSDQFSLAESIFHTLLTNKMSPDTALYTLYLRALCQQNKWEEAEKLFTEMVTGKYATRPNTVTLNYFLQYQMLAGRWTEASVTFDMIVDGFVFFSNDKIGSQAAKLFKDVNNIRGNPSASYRPMAVSSMQGTFQTLSMMLGTYSSVVQRMYEEENLRLQRSEKALRQEKDDSIYLTPILEDYSPSTSKFIFNYVL